MRKSVTIALLVSILFVMKLGSAIDVDDTSINSTRTRVEVEDAVSLYGFEVNFSIDSGTVTTPGSTSFYPNLTAGASSSSQGGSQKNGYLYVYQARMDSTHTGISGDFNLFNITHSSDAELTLRGATFIYSDGDIEYKSYNVPAVPEEEDDESGGSGGGSGTIIYKNVTNTTRNLIYRENKDIEVDPVEFNLNIIRGVEAEREFVISYSGREVLEIEFEGDGDMKRALGFEEESIVLGTGERRVRFGVLINSNGLKTGNILLINGNYIVKKIPVIANVRSEEFLFDVKMEIPEQFQRVYSGENVYTNIELVQVGPQLKVDVVANYILKDLEGNSYYEDSETFFVLGEKIYSREFPTTSLKPGKHVVGLEVVYPGAFAVSSAQFEIVNKGPLGLGENAEWILVGAGILVLACAIVIIWALKRRKSLKKFKRK